MTGIEIKDLGLTQDELTNRVVQVIADNLMAAYMPVEDGDIRSPFHQVMEQKVTDAIDAAVENIAARNVLPNVETYVENLCLQKTNEWGEAKGTSLTFTEYLVQRAEAYLNETVDYEGKPKGKNSYAFRGAQTRITHLVEKHLHFHIERAMKEAVQNANSQIADGIAETVKLKLQDISKRLRVEAKVKG